MRRDSNITDHTKMHTHIRVNTDVTKYCPRGHSNRLQIPAFFSSQLRCVYLISNNNNLTI